MTVDTDGHSIDVRHLHGPHVSFTDAEPRRPRRHEDARRRQEISMLRVPQPACRTNSRSLIHDTIGCCIAVHRELGPGLLESDLRAGAVGIELTAAGIPFEREKAYPGQLSRRTAVPSASRLRRRQTRSFSKSSQSNGLRPVHHAQLLNYLRVARLRVGLLMNFNVAVLQDGIATNGPVSHRSSSCVFVSSCLRGRA